MSESQKVNIRDVYNSVCVVLIYHKNIGDEALGDYFKMVSESNGEFPLHVSKQIHTKIGEKRNCQFVLPYLWNPHFRSILTKNPENNFMIYDNFSPDLFLQSILYSLDHEELSKFVEMALRGHLNQNLVQRIVDYNEEIQRMQEKTKEIINQNGCLVTETKSSSSDLFRNENEIVNIERRMDKIEKSLSELSLVNTKILELIEALTSSL